MNRSEGCRRIETAWNEALQNLPSCIERKRPSQNPSFGGILKRHITSVEHQDDQKDKEEGTRTRDLLDQWDLTSKRERLLTLVQMFKRLEPILTSCKKKLESIESDREAGGDPVSLESLIAYGRRISAHVRAPPEYNDPTGNDGLCIPGYFFPCPDYLTMSRSSLFHADKIRSVPPSIAFKPDPRTRTMHWIEISTPTPNPTIRFAINSISSWSVYVPTQKPYVAGPGHYTVRAYCQAEGFYVSEVTVAYIDIPPFSSKESLVIEPHSQVESPRDQPTTAPQPSLPVALPTNTLKSGDEPASRAQPPTVAVGSGSVKFGGLFLSGASPSSEEESDEESEEDDEESTV